MAYETFTEATAIDYAREHTDIFTAGAALSCREIGDGNLNMVFRIVDDNDPSRSVIIKQSLPTARISDAFVLPLERANQESEILVLHDKLAPGLAPKVHFFDPERFAIVMEDLSDHVVLRKGLIKGVVYPRLAQDMGTFLAQTLFATTDVGMDPLEKKELQRRFINPDLCKITEDLVFSEPYFDAEQNKIDPEIRERAEANWRDDELKREVAVLKEKFMTQGQALIHGDLHTGSVFVTESSTKAFDPEFGFFGPIGFDIGAILGNLVLNHASQLYHKPDVADREAYRTYLTDTFAGIWNVFEARFRQLWTESVKTPMESNPLYREAYIARLLADAIGYAGCKMTRRIVGIAQVEDIRSIPDARIRAEAQIAVLDTARELIMRRHEFATIDGAVAVIRKHQR